MIKKENQNDKKQSFPFVSVCTPTFNRRPFIENMFNCFRNQTYPKHCIEWIIIDDGTDKIKDLIEKANIPQIRYFEVNEKMSLGAKRNYMHRYVRGSIIVYMDDDDYYPPERIEDAVEKLLANPNALCAGSSEIYIYFKHIQKMYKCGPYNPNHATAGTFAFRKELLNITKYEEHAAVAEERAFLKDYTIPFVQLDPMKAILVFSHNHNTFDKKKMLDNPHPDFFRECDKTVEMFIRKKSEINIYNFFMRDIDKLLENYEPGEPKMKPDVLKQIKEIEEKREEMIKEEMEKQKANGPIMLQQPGKPPIALSNQDIVNLIQQQQQQLQLLVQKCEQNDNTVQLLQKQLLEKTKIIKEFSSGNEVNLPVENSESVTKLENIITLLQKQLIEKTKIIRELNASGKASNESSQSHPEQQSSSSTSSNEMQNMISVLQKQLIEKTKTIRELTAERLQQSDVMSTSSNTDDESINKLENKIVQLENVISLLQSQLIDKNKEIQQYKKEKQVEKSFTRIPIEIENDIKPKNKSDPEIVIVIEE